MPRFCQDFVWISCSYSTWVNSNRNQFFGISMAFFAEKCKARLWDTWPLGLRTSKICDLNLVQNIRHRLSRNTDFSVFLRRFYQSHAMQFHDDYVFFSGTKSRLTRGSCVWTSENISTKCGMQDLRDNQHYMLAALQHGSCF